MARRAGARLTVEQRGATKKRETGEKIETNC
jgi:hypothetical protein